LNRLDAAVAAYRRAVRTNPGLSRAWYAAGCAENSRKEYAVAADCFERAREIDPERLEVQHNLANALYSLGQIDRALELFQRCAAGPRGELSLGMIAVIVPGSLKADHAAILGARRAFAGQLPGPRPAKRFGPRTSPRDRPLRIGYVSSFFHRHNWMKPVWGLINRHDRGRFEIHLFSDAPLSAIQHGYRQEPEDRFHDISAMSNEAVADRMEECGIDVLVDLNGYSNLRRLPLIALRPAPVVLGWFNIYATTGMPAYDYLISDDVVNPAAEDQFYCEKIVRVPGSYLTFEVGYPVPEVASAPRAVSGTVTFGCLAPQYKITNEVIAAWCRILQQVPKSSLILKSTALGSSDNQRFVRELFQKHGIAAERLRLFGPSDHFEFLEVYGQIDVALDTFPYNGGTTTSEAIWQGVPVVAFWGDRWVSRTSASILKAAGLGEFVADGLEGYVSLAVSLANSAEEAEKLLELRRDMRSRLRASPICDTAFFARHFEREMFRFIEEGG